MPGTPPVEPRKPFSEIMVPGTKIPVDAAIGYGAAIATEIANAGLVTDPKLQTILHGVAVVLVAIAHGLHTDGV